MNDRCLITGASGFLGAAIAERLREESTVTGVGHQQAYEGLRCDLRDASAVKNLLSETLPDVVVHCAAYRNPDVCAADPAEARRMNVGSIQNLCDLLAPSSYLVFISSDYVFDGTAPPYTEDSLRSAVNLYGQTKIEGEDIIAQRPNALSLRVPVLVGAGDTLANSGYIGQLISGVRNKTPMHEDAYHVRFPTWTHDVAEAISFLMSRRSTGVMHYSGSAGETRYEAAQSVARLLGER